MPLETGDFISDLVETNPLGSDNVSQGDDHLRLIKHVLKSQFPNLNCAVTATCEDLNNAGRSLQPVVTTYTTPGNFTHTFTAGRTWCKVIVTGGGGGGYDAGSGRGGFAAGTSIKTTNITQSTASVTVGAAGAPGTTGGTSQFGNGAATVTVPGGPAGVVSVDTPTSGSIGTGGDINIRGGGPEADVAGMGGGSYWAGGNSTDASAAANNSSCFGTGGRGRSATQGSRQGVSGVVYIEEY